MYTCVITINEVRETGAGCWRLVEVILCLKKAGIFSRWHTLSWARINHR